MTISHPSFSHLNKQPTEPAREVPVHNIMPPEDEAVFAKQMELIEKTIAPPAKIETGMPGLLDDAVIKAQLEKKRIFEKLTFFKEEHIKQVVIAELTFSLKLLNSNENAYVWKIIKAHSEDEQMSKLAIMILAAALVDISGVRLEDTYSGPPEIVEPVLRRYYEISQWHGPLVKVLTDAYTDFQNEVQGQYGKSFLVK